MDPSTLLRRWEENAHRPQWVIDARDQLAEYTDTADPIPRRKADLGDWMDRYKPTVTRQLREAASEEEDGGTPLDGDAEGESE